MNLDLAISFRISGLVDWNNFVIHITNYFQEAHLSLFVRRVKQDVTVLVKLLILGISYMKGNFGKLQGRCEAEVRSLSGRCPEGTNRI